MRKKKDDGNGTSLEVQPKGKNIVTVPFRKGGTLDINLDEVEKLASERVPVESIAYIIGMSEHPFKKAREEFEEVEAALKRGKSYVDAKQVIDVTPDQIGLDENHD
jgi:hypothetical protein